MFSIVRVTRARPPAAGRQIDGVTASLRVLRELRGSPSLFCVLRELRVYPPSARSVLSCARSEDPVNHRASTHRLVLVVAFALLFAPLLIRAQEQAQSAAPPKPAASACGRSQDAAADHARRLSALQAASPTRRSRPTASGCSTPSRRTKATARCSSSRSTRRRATRFRAARTRRSPTTRAGSGTSFRRRRRRAEAGAVDAVRGGGRGDAPAQGDAAAAQAPPRAFEVLDLTTGTKTHVPGGREFFVFTGRRMAAVAPARRDACAGGGQCGCRARRTRRRGRRQRGRTATRPAPTC